ncbi:hypothetical protein J2S34_003855 [Nitrobacter winogradskyi]|uniref:Uncharacterized protein n=1 Tax=Nitrobacter winogradskyi TaxID=913 RepID=A0ACC6APP1_NITWI|nr:hypothetical protein [Nitrobacter winogradskyi]
MTGITSSTAERKQEQKSLLRELLQAERYYPSDRRVWMVLAIVVHNRWRCTQLGLASRGWPRAETRLAAALRHHVRSPLLHETVRRSRLRETRRARPNRWAAAVYRQKSGRGPTASQANNWELARGSEEQRAGAQNDSGFLGAAQ